MIRTAIATAALAGALLSGSAQAENFGCVSKAQCAKMERIIRAWFPSYVENTMICIARRESGLNPRAANWGDSNGGSFGLFQMNGVHDPTTRSHASKWWINKMFNPVANTRAAYRLWKGSGTGPWTTRGGC